MRYVYVIRNQVTCKVYIGQTKNPKGRKAGHWCAGRTGNPDTLLYRSMRKHGVENFSFEVIEECADEAIDERERFWVAHFDSFNPEKGYNLTSGGEGGKEFSNESCEKIRQKALKRQSPSEETRRKIGDATRGKPNPQFQKLRAEQHGSRNPMFGRCGERHPRSKLTQAQVDEIRNRKLTLFETIASLAEEFGVSRLTIRRIRNNEIYNK